MSEDWSPAKPMCWPLLKSDALAVMALDDLCNHRNISDCTIYRNALV